LKAKSVRHFTNKEKQGEIKDCTLYSIVGKKRDLRILDPMIFSGKIQKIRKNTQKSKKNIENSEKYSENWEKNT